MNWNDTSHLLQALLVCAVFFAFWHGYGIGVLSQ